MEDHSHYTNQPELWEKLKLKEKNIALWNTDQNPNLQDFDLKWNNIKTLFCVGTGGFNRQPNIKCKVEYFDSMISTEKNVHTHLLALEQVKGHFVVHDIQSKLKTIDEKIDSLTYIDALLGLQKVHRDFVNNWINDSQHKEKYFLNYYHSFNNWQSWIPGYWQDEKQPFSYSGDFVNIPNVGHWMLSQIVPVNIYNQTFYSIIAETKGFGPSIPTEKLWKPILSRRVFVAVTNKNYLRDIRNLGFKTFDSILDESYDSIDNDEDRWASAMTQCDWLCLQDPKQVINEAKSILEHNFNLAMEDHNAEFENLLLQVANEC